MDENPRDSHSSDNTHNSHSSDNPHDSHSLDSPHDVHSSNNPHDVHSSNNPHDVHSLDSPHDVHSSDNPHDSHSSNNPHDVHSSDSPHENNASGDIATPCKYARGSDEYYMTLALAEAGKALAHGDVPVGAVIVRDGTVIAAAHNTRERDKSPTAHAELKAIEEASAKTGSWRLYGCTLYVTLEPCVMCAGAIVNCRLPEVVCGCPDPKAGAMGSVINVNSYPLNHKPKIKRGVLEPECSAILREFFAAKRK